MYPFSKSLTFDLKFDLDLYNLKLLYVGDLIRHLSISKTKQTWFKYINTLQSIDKKLYFSMFSQFWRPSWTPC